MLTLKQELELENKAFDTYTQRTHRSWLVFVHQLTPLLPHRSLKVRPRRHQIRELRLQLIFAL